MGETLNSLYLIKPFVQVFHSTQRWQIQDRYSLICLSFAMGFLMSRLRSFVFVFFHLKIYVITSSRILMVKCFHDFQAFMRRIKQILILYSMLYHFSELDTTFSLRLLPIIMRSTWLFQRVWQWNMTHESVIHAKFIE